MKNFNFSELVMMCASCCFLVSGLMHACGTDTNNGIYAHPTGEAAYIAGEACVINDLPEIDFQTMGAWCNAQRASP